MRLRARLKVIRRRPFFVFVWLRIFALYVSLEEGGEFFY